jgi:di/tricarboxylate transporter
MKPEFIVLGLIIAGALYLFWTQKLHTDVTAALVMLSLVVPWPRPDGKWSAILSPQEAFSGFGSVAVIMVTAMFAFSASMIRTGAAEMIGERLFRACAHHEFLLQAAILSITAACSMFINETTIVLVFMPVVLAVCKERHLSPSRYLAALLLGCVKLSDTYKSVNWPAIATVGGMISLGLALEKTGAAEALAHAIVTNFQWAGATSIFCALLAFTVALTQLIENAAVAIILAPIAYQIAQESHADPKPFMVGLAICISTSFCTPVAHETTMLVMGPGRYRFKNYLSIGSGMAVIAWLLAAFVTPKIWKF